MRRIWIAWALAILWAGSSFSFCASGNQEAWTGYVTDTHCGTNCQTTSQMTPDLKCIRRCVKKGSKYGLWSGKRVYLLEPQAKAARFAAKNVRVQGILKGDTIQIVSIGLTPDAVPAQGFAKP